MKKSKTTIALLLAALMLLGTAGMAFASEESASGGASGTELPLERGYSWYTCTAPEYLNIRAERSTADADNIRGAVCSNVHIQARDLGDGWAMVNFCGNYCYVSTEYLVPRW
jgi:hypothetical protein